MPAPSQRANRRGRESPQGAERTVAPGERRRLVPDDVIHQPGLEERAGGRRTTLDQELQDVVVADLVEHLCQVTR